MGPNRKRRILFYTENYMRGGGNKYLIDLINGVLKEENDIILLNNKEGVFKEDLQRVDGKIIHAELGILSTAAVLFKTRAMYFPLRLFIFAGAFLLIPFFALFNFLKFRYALRKYRPDLVVACNGGYPAAPTVLQMNIAAKTMGIPNILSIVSMPNKRSLREIIPKWKDKLVNNAVSTVIVNAGNLKQNLHKLRNFHNNKIQVIHNGIPDIHYTAPIGPSAGTVFGFLGRIDKAKGVLVLAAAFEKLIATHPGIKLILIGQGDSTEQIASGIREKGLSEKVEHTGFFQGDVHEKLKEMDVFVLPSYQEGLPYSILEAMRAGCAIVSTQVGGIPEIIESGVNGILVPPDNVSALENAMKELILDPDKIKRLARAGRERFLQEFTLEKMYADINKII